MWSAFIWVGQPSLEISPAAKVAKTMRASTGVHPLGTAVLDERCLEQTESVSRQHLIKASASRLRIVKAV